MRCCNCWVSSLTGFHWNHSNNRIRFHRFRLSADPSQHLHRSQLCTNRSLKLSSSSSLRLWFPQPITNHSLWFTRKKSIHCIKLSQKLNNPESQKSQITKQNKEQNKISPLRMRSEKIFWLQICYIPQQNLQFKIWVCPLWIKMPLQNENLTWVGPKFIYK